MLFDVNRTFHRLIYFVFVYFLVIPISGHSEVFLLASKDNRSFEIAKKIQQKITQEVIIKNEIDASDRYEILVSIGDPDNYTINNHSNTPIIASFLPYTAHIDRENKNLIVFYSEPSPQDIYSFFEKNFENTNIGILYNQLDAEYIQSIEKLLLPSKNNLIKVKQNDENTFRGIRQLIKKDIDIMLITKNSEIYQNRRIRFVIESLLRKRIPSITTSKSLLPAGGAISITPNEDEIISHIVKIINNYLENKELSDLDKSQQIKVDININNSINTLFNLSIEDI